MMIFAEFAPPPPPPPPDVSQHFVHRIPAEGKMTEMGFVGCYKT